MLFNKELLKRAHKLTREFKKEYPNIDYHVQLGLFISYLIEEEKLNREISLEEYFKDMKNNPNYYNYIFYNNNIIVKNGRLSEDIDKDGKVSANYQILYNEIEDIKNSVIVKIIEYFKKHKVLKYKYRGTLYGQLLANTLRGHSRHLQRFRSYNENRYNFIGCNNGVKTILHEDDQTSLFRLDLLNVLSDRQIEIISLLEQGYNKSEIAKLVGISRQAVHKNINTIKKVLIEEKLVTGY